MSNRDLPRRSFLKLGALGAAGAALADLGTPNRIEAETGRSVTTDDGLKLGVASYSLRNFSRPQAIEMTKALGTPYINLKSVHLPYDLTAAEIAAARREIEGAGLHIVGGGSRNELLNQFTANATGRRVIAGPVEATAIGNLLVQAIAMQHLDSLAALRGVVRDSFDVATFEPGERNVWENAYEKFSKGAA